MIILGDGCGYFLVLKNCHLKSIQGKACRSTMGYTHVYWKDISQLLENYTLRFDTRRREKVRLTGCGSSVYSSLLVL